MLFVLLDNIRSAYNVGAILRTADGAGVDGMIVTGYTPLPSHKKVIKTALGAELTVPWVYFDDAAAALQQLRQGTFSPRAKSSAWDFADIPWQDYQILAFEVTPQATGIFDRPLPRNTIAIFGNEVTGVQPELLTLADRQVVIPMYGQKQSLNVAASLAVAVYEYARQFGGDAKRRSHR
jgi:23S rRNA (guanosine2251-2'-O)-methyltransferase